MPPGGGTAAGGCAATGSWVFGCGLSEAAAGTASGAAPVVAAGVAVVGCEVRFGGLGTGCEE